MPVAKSLKVFQAELDKAYPSRPKPDGFYGDKAHSKRKSDHNPDKYGYVTAGDFKRDDRFSTYLADRLRALGKAGDGRVKYVIFRGRICSSVDSWAWRKYKGSNPHNTHIHLSVSSNPKQYNREDAWALFPKSKPIPKKTTRVYCRVLKLTKPLMKGPDVEHYQKRLIAKKCLIAKSKGKSTADGFYGELTVLAVKSFQRKKGLEETGVINNSIAMLLDS